MVNVVDLMRLLPDTAHPHGLPDSEFDTLFTEDRPVIFAFHGYPWLVHRLTYRRCNGTPSTAATLAILGQADDADFGQTWHLPNYSPMTGYEFCATLGEVCNCTVVPRPVSAGMLRVFGVFNPAAQATRDTLYQSTNDYLFSDKRFRTRFPGFKQESFAQLLAATVNYYGAPRP